MVLMLTLYRLPNCSGFDTLFRSGSNFSRGLTESFGIAHIPTVKAEMYISAA